MDKTKTKAKDKPQPVHATGQQWKLKTSGAVITLDYCTKSTAQYDNGRRMLRVSTLVRDYVKIK